VVTVDGVAVKARERAGTVDRLTERVLARLAPLAFEVARTPADRDAVLRMRYACVVAQGWARPEELPNGRERDEYDDEAVFVACRDGEELVGSMRLVPASPERPLPTERDFGIRARPAGAVLEAGRIVVAPSVRRGRGHLVLAGLCARGWMEAYARGYDRAIAAAAPELIELYRGLGLRVSVLGPPRRHWGVERAPIQLEGDERTLAVLAAAVPRGPSA